MRTKTYTDPIMCHPNVCQSTAYDDLKDNAELSNSLINDPDFSDKEREEILEKHAGNQITWKNQRVTRGFDDTELWNFDHTICTWLVPRLKAFREGTVGYPPDMTYEEWMDTLDKMIYGFELYITEKEEDNFEEFKENEKTRDDAVREALTLLTKHFTSLWW